MTDENKSPLSKRESQVLEAVSRGLSNQEIATELVISVNTVRVHLRNIFEKLNVQSRTEATMRAFQEGWLAPPQTAEAAAAAPAPVAQVDVIPAEPPLSPWRQAYFFGAALIALLVLAMPIVAPALRPTDSNPIADAADNNVVPADSQSNSKWQYQAEMPTARSRLALAAIDDKLYLIGGDRTSGTTGLVEIFDSRSKTWQEAASKPTLTANIQGVVIGDEIFVPGGCTADSEPTAQLEIFNPAQNEWRTGASLPQPLCGYAAAAYNGELYVIGGWDGLEYLDSVYIYHPEDDAWRQESVPYPLKVGFAAAAIHDDALVVAGGYDGEKEYADVYRWDEAAGAWVDAPAMNRPRGGLGLVSVGDTLFAMGGGWTTNLTANEKLVGDAAEWQEIETPYGEQWRNFGLAAIDSEIYAAGGWNQQHLDSLVSYKTLYRVFVPITY